MNSSNASPDLSALLGAAQADDNLSPAGLQALSINDLGANIQAGLGLSVDDVKTSEVTLLVIVLDDSSSIRFTHGNTEAVRDGMNLILKSLADTKQAESILAYCIQLNRGVLFPFTPIIDGKTKKLDQQLLLTPQNYNPSGGTPLYDTVLTALGTAVAKVAEFSIAGVPARSVTIILTDGDNCGGTKVHPESTKPVVDDLLRKEMHIVAFMGIKDGQTDFEDIAKRMGIRKEWILTPSNDASSIRHACATVSQSAVRASQTAGASGFSKVTAGGFGG